MDKKAKKRLEVIKQKLTQLQQQLVGAKQQMDDPADVKRIESEIAALQAERDRLKS
jgi:cob(I)alamin adenosyltransferase